jgi:hypothetical protein
MAASKHLAHDTLLTVIFSDPAFCRTCKAHLAAPWSSSKLEPKEWVNNADLISKEGMTQNHAGRKGLFRCNAADFARKHGDFGWFWKGETDIFGIESFYF